MFHQEIHSDLAPKAIGPYSQGIKVGDFVYLSGMLPVNPETGLIESSDIKEQTQQVFNNILAVLSSLGCDLSHVVKTTVYMKDLSMFNDMNEVYAMFFEKPYPARSCVEVARLPKDALVEIECFVIDTVRYEKQSQGCGGCGGGCNDGCCEDGCCE